MEIAAALLRGINVGGRNQVAMADLRALFVGLGCENVRTYLQSGNVVFEHRLAPDELVRAAEEQIQQDLGLAASVVLRSGAELAEVLTQDPFVRRGAKSGECYVSFLADAPEPGALAGVPRRNAEGDEFLLIGRQIYLHCPGGYGRTKLNNAFFERRLGTVATTRNWRTLEKLVEPTAR